MSEFDGELSELSMVPVANGEESSLGSDDDSHDDDSPAAKLMEAVRNGESAEVIESILESSSGIHGNDLFDVLEFAYKDRFEFAVDEEESFDRQPEVWALIFEHGARDLETARLERDDGKFLLHYACGFGVPLTVIELLLEMNPEAASASDHDRGMLPLHLALCNKAPTEVIMALLKCFPEGAHMVDDHGYGCSPLDYSYHSLEAVQALVDLYPESVSKADMNGCLPLHNACHCENDTVFEIVQFLLEQYPDGAEVKDEFGSYPLHYAAEGDNVEVVNVLIRLFPDAVCLANDDGILPIHYACARKISQQSIQMLMDYYSGDLRYINATPPYYNGLAVADNKGQLPLHYAALNERITRESLQLLVDTYPEGIRVGNNDGKLPVHLACSDENSANRLERVRFFVETDLFTVLHTADDGTTPLRASFALTNRVRFRASLSPPLPMEPQVQAQLLETRRFLLEKQDEALRIYCDAFECLPEHIVVEDILGFAYGNIWRPTEDEVNTIEE